MTNAKHLVSRYFLILALSFQFQAVYSAPNVHPLPSKLVDEIYNSTYHFEFQKVDSLIHTNESNNKNDLDFNLAVVNYYWWRLISGKQNDKFAALVSKRIEQIRSNNSFKKSGQDATQLFRLISIYAYSARISLLDYSYYDALTDLSQYYSWLKLSFGREQDYHPFYLTSGLYYFFTGYARQQMPLLSPLLYFYTTGNMETGIQYLKTAEMSGDWKISQEAKYFLMKINFDVYKNYSESARYCNQLMALYPENLLFQLYIFRISLAIKQVANAKARIKIMEVTSGQNTELTLDEKSFYLGQAKAELEAFEKKKK